jgi:hypothetical protein
MRAALPPERSRTPQMVRSQDLRVGIDRRHLVGCPTQVTR